MPAATPSVTKPSNSSVAPLTAQLRASCATTFSGTTTIIGGDLNGDGISDFNIMLTGRITLAVSDFVL